MDVKGLVANGSLRPNNEWSTRSAALRLRKIKKANVKKAVSSEPVAVTPVGDLPRALGRPRAESVRVAILAATMQLLESETVESITIEAIAKEAKVSKATIYRWWRSKVSVVIDAFIEHYIPLTPMPDTLSPEEALARHIKSVVEQYAGWPGRIVAQILAAGQYDPDVLEEFRNRFIFDRMSVVHDKMEKLCIERGLDSQRLPGDLQEMFFAPIYMRLLLGYAPLNRRFADRLVQMTMKLIAQLEREARDKRPATA